ncbi:hypothetical protein DPMN_072095 [Dreissena polymorpha]|uniref:Uncharacterized protein n=1 Tax=Dreissena polymorpha TaxID=45954 RepID=A0A9D3Z3V4_DREPO|nr:hypothetical protein DPMN_072095 [Dreissena polymorpha]
MVAEAVVAVVVAAAAAVVAAAVVDRLKCSADIHFTNIFHVMICCLGLFSKFNVIMYV